MLPILMAASAFTLAFCWGEQGEEDWINGTQDYLFQRYIGDFQFLGSQVEEGVTILTYQTLDELELVFEVRCWVDGLDTPWGEFPLIPQRKYTENFIQCLDRRFIGEAPVDASGYSLDEMVELFQHTWEWLNEAYGQYGADWVTPNFEMEVCYEGTTASIRYMGQDASILRDTLVRELLAEDSRRRVARRDDSKLSVRTSGEGLFGKHPILSCSCHFTGHATPRLLTKQEHTKELGLIFPLKSYIFTTIPLDMLKTSIFLDFNIYVGYPCVKHQNISKEYKKTNIDS